MTTKTLTMHAQAIDPARTSGEDSLPARLAAGRLPGFPLWDGDKPPAADESMFTDRAAVVEALADYNASVGNALSNETLDALRADGRLIIAGQQPGLLTGPMYTILKAATAIGLGERLRANARTPLVPAFWLATEDHDLEEVNRVTIGSGTLVVDHEELRNGPRPPVGCVSLAHARERVLGFLHQTLRTHPHGGEVVDAVAACDFADYARLCATLLTRLFGAGRLVLVDPMALRGPAARVLERIVERREAIGEALREGAAMLREAKLAPPLDRANLFEVVEGRRRRIRLDDHRLKPDQLIANIRDEPDRYSPSAALRPIVQDAVLPVAATIAGPSELAYLWQIGPIYRAMDVRRSRLWPRCGATFVDGETAAAAERFGLIGERLFDAAPRLATYSPAAYGTPGDDLDRIAEWRDRLIDRIDDLAGQDEGVDQRVAKAKRSIDYQVNKVIDRALDRRLARRGLSKGDLGRIAAVVRPRGKPQERVTNVLEFVARYGWDFIDRMIDELDPTTIAHHLVIVDTVNSEGERT